MTGDPGPPLFAGVIGWPAAHSLSPLMMKTWLEASGVPGDYGLFEVAPDHFEAFVRANLGTTLCGLNVTLPHKEAALALADEATDHARAIGAANVLRRAGNTIIADNTDLVGIEAALEKDPGTGPAVLIGAGGAARAALYHLKGQEREIRIVNRTLSKAETLSQTLGVKTTPMGDAQAAIKQATLVINATSLGMTGMPELSLDLGACAPGAVVFDMVYTPLETGLLKGARDKGLTAIDGLTMLIAQARPSFEAFFGHPAPDSGMVRTRLVERLEGGAA